MLNFTSPAQLVAPDGLLGSRGHSLDFLVSETYGEEVTSILETAALWTRNVSAFIGPQETCVHEAKLAAAFNLPMISYVSIPFPAGTTSAIRLVFLGPLLRFFSFRPSFSCPASEGHARSP